jgi:hypothetical protein
MAECEEDCEGCETQKHGKPISREEMLKAIETYKIDRTKKTKDYVR